MGIIRDIKDFRDYLKLKQLTQSLESNQVIRALYQYLYPGSIAMMADDPQIYIDEAHGKNAWLAAVVGYIASKGADFPIILYEYDAKGDKIEIGEHEILDIVEQPNRLMGKYEFFELQLKWDMLTGQQYHYAPRVMDGNNKGRIPKDDEGYYQLMPIPPPMIEIVSGGPLDPIKGYKLKGSYNIQVPEYCVLQIRRGTLTWGHGRELYGESPVKPLRTTIATSNAAQTAQWASFRNGGINGIVNILDVDDPAMLDLLKSRFEKDTQGADKTGKIHVTGGAEMQYFNMGRSNQELQIMESELESLRKICSTYDISSVIFGDPRPSTYNNMREAKKAAYNDAIIPRVNRILNGYNKWLCPYYSRPGKYLWLELNEEAVPVMQQDQREKWEWLSRVFELTPNERLRLAGLPESESEEMDQHWFPASLMPVEGSMTMDEEKESEVSKQLDKFYAEHNIRDYEQ